LGPEAYTPAAARSVYGILVDKARRTLSAGHSVVVDAVYARPQERADLEDMANALDVPLHGLWLTADAELLASRVAQRRNDASDATVEVVQQQLDYEIGELSAAWTVVDAGGDIETTLSQAQAVLKRR
jgi:predicted kinase